MTIPEKMLAVTIHKVRGEPTPDEIAVPQPGPGQVLVRIAASPVNPSDIAFMKGGYGFQSPFPLVPGFEGSGTVVKGGAGLVPRILLGKRVACAAPHGGMWAEYVVTSAASCIPLGKRVSLEQGATSIVNPMTALAFFEIARRERHAAIVNTAAAGALGKMVLRIGIRKGIPIIHIVRRREQADILSTMGAEHVLCTEDPDFLKSFQELSHTLQATLILDAIGGELSQQMIQAAPFGSTLVIYGFLAGGESSVDLKLLAKEDKRAVGFFLPNWLRKKSLIQRVSSMRKIQKLIQSDLATHVHQRFPLSRVGEALETYGNHMSAGKVLLIGSPEDLPVG